MDEYDVNLTLWLERYFSNATAVGQVPEPPGYLLAIWTLLYVLVFGVGLFGNTAVTAVVLRCRTMRTSINFLFLNLCIADLLVLLITGPTAVMDMYAKEAWHLGSFMCKLITFLENTVGNASAVTILAISVERYRVACRTLTQQPASCRFILRTSLLIWLTSSVAALPLVFITNLTTDTLLDDTTVPVCKTPITLAWHKAYAVLTTVLFLVLPLLVIYVLYVQICRRLIALFKREQEKLRSCYPREIVILKRQMIQIIVTVVLVFFVCHTPYRAVVLWSLFADRATLAAISFEAYLNLIYLTRILLYANHAINPFVYNFVSRHFRRAFVWLCCERERRRRMARLEDGQWHDLSNLRSFQRHDSARGFRGRCDVDNKARDKEEMECLGRGHQRYQRNDFLVLYENFMLLE